MPKKSNDNAPERRARNFATVIYPESAPSNFQDVIRDLKAPCALSPLHSNDINPDGTPKKPHFHLILAFDGPKSLSSVRDLISPTGAVGLEIVESLRGYTRYLCHLDNPEKAQYDIEGVQCFGGFDYLGTINLPTDKYKAVREMISFCIDNHCFIYADLLEYASEARPDWFRVLCDSATVVIKEYLKSRAYRSDLRERR